MFSRTRTGKKKKKKVFGVSGRLEDTFRACLAVGTNANRAIIVASSRHFEMYILLSYETETSPKRSLAFLRWEYKILISNDFQGKSKFGLLSNRICACRSTFRHDHDTIEDEVVLVDVLC